jgi:hypothetical protein
MGENKVRFRVQGHSESRTHHREETIIVLFIDRFAKQTEAGYHECGKEDCE